VDRRDLTPSLLNAWITPCRHEPTASSACLRGISPRWRTARSAGYGRGHRPWIPAGYRLAQRRRGAATPLAERLSPLTLDREGGVASHHQRHRRPMLRHARLAVRTCGRGVDRRGHHCCRLIGSSVFLCRATNMRFLRLPSPPLSPTLYPLLPSLPTFVLSPRSSAGNPIPAKSPLKTPRMSPASKTPGTRCCAPPHVAGAAPDMWITPPPFGRPAKLRAAVDNPW